MLAKRGTTGIPLKQKQKSKDIVLFSESRYQKSKGL